MLDFARLIEEGLSKLGLLKYGLVLSSKFIDGQTIDIGRNVRIERDCIIRGSVKLADEVTVSRGSELIGSISIGKGTNLNAGVDIKGDVRIGRYCAIAPDVRFQQRNHQTQKMALQTRFYDRVLDSELELVADGPITIGNDVWIGAGAIILPGVTIGSGAVVGAGAVVTSDVDAYEVVAGVPANHIKWRFPADIRERLLEIEWWKFSEKTLREHRQFFNTKIGTVDDIPDFNE